MQNNDSGQSFVRWQAITREQLTYAINLILGLSVAALGFELSLVLKWKIGDVVCTNKLALTMSYAFVTTSVFSVLLLAGSVGAGIQVVMNRLTDFRLTQNIARRREQMATDNELKADRDRSDALGKKTWCLFKRQVFLFGAGMLFAILSVAADVVFQAF